MNIEKAVEDVSVIREILEKTKNDISQISLFFVWVGIVKIVNEVLKVLGYVILDRTENITLIMWEGLRLIDMISFVGIIVIYLFYYKKILIKKNSLSISILKIWGYLLIGGTVIGEIVYCVDSNLGEYSTISQMHFLKEIYFFLPIIGFVILGTIIHDKKIVIFAGIMISLYLVLLGMNNQIVVGVIHDHQLTINSSDLLTSIIMSIGLVGLGIYLKCLRGK